MKYVCTDEKVFLLVSLSGVDYKQKNYFVMGRYRGNQYFVIIWSISSQRVMKLIISICLSRVELHLFTFATLLFHVRGIISSWGQQNSINTLRTHTLHGFELTCPTSIKAEAERIRQPSKLIFARYFYQASC